MNEIDYANWGDSERWIVSVDGDATDDQPDTLAGIDNSDRFFGPFNTKKDALHFIDAYKRGSNQ